MNANRSILLIDDDDTANFISKVIIERSLKFSHIETAISGIAGLKYLQSCIVNKSSLPSHILLDINMPIMTGWDFLDKLEEFDKNITKDIIVYLLSSSQNPEDADLAETHPLVKGFIHKPLVFDKFVEIID